MTEAQQAAKILPYLVRAVVWAMIVVALYAQIWTHRGASWELLWIAAATMAGSAGLDWLTATVARLVPDDDWR